MLRTLDKTYLFSTANKFGMKLGIETLVRIYIHTYWICPWSRTGQRPPSIVHPGSLCASNVKCPYVRCSSSQRDHWNKYETEFDRNTFSKNFKIPRIEFSNDTCNNKNVKYKINTQIYFPEADLIASKLWILRLTMQNSNFSTWSFIFHFLRSDALDCDVIGLYSNTTRVS